ncbi:MAG: hypothetical protein ACRCYO_13580 [Bacteroidia bacterium]
MPSSLFSSQSDKAFIEVDGSDSIIATVQKWGDETIKLLRESLQRKVSSGTSKTLEQSIVVLPITFANDKYMMTFKASDYWKYINSGVRGVGGINKSTGQAFQQKAPQSEYSFKEKKPPVSFSSLTGASLRQWAFNKNLSEYAVRESVFRSGIKATHFFDEVVTPTWSNDLAKRVAKAAGREIKIVFTRDFKLKK